jgi:hypothetical protein
MRHPHRWRALFPLLSLMLLPATAHAAVGAFSMHFNTSARDAGMGETGIATIWGGDVNVWANPAMLAFRPGVRYGTMHSKLAEGLADNIYIDKKELTFGAYGAGLLFADGPIDHVYLDMGEQTGTDESGNETGTFRSYMKSQSWGLGLSTAELLRQLKVAEIGGWFDLAGGIVWKDYEDQLAGSDIVQDVFVDSHASASMKDLGWVARVTPLNTLVRSASAAEAKVGFLLEASYGSSKLNDTDEFIVHGDVDQRDPAPTTYLSGWAVHAELQSGPQLMADASPLLRASIAPLVAFTYTQQNSVPGYVWNGDGYVYERDESGTFDEEAWGYEVSLLNVLHLRRGHVSVPYGDIDGDTEGWGLSFQAGRYGGIRYDEATVPQAEGLPTVTREGWHFWVDALALFARE